jgi:hypothetical protein
VSLEVSADGVVIIMEPGRALACEDVAAVTGLPVIATIPLRAEPLATAATRSSNPP